jgi:hypothetical protein
MTSRVMKILETLHIRAISPLHQVGPYFNIVTCWRVLRRYMREWDDNIKCCLKKIECEGGEWINLAQ